MKKRMWMWLCIVLVAILLGVSGIQISDKINSPDNLIRFGIGNEKVITLGHVAYAAGVVDYAFDGVDDDVQFQTALDALPATGGRIVVVSATTINFSNTVTRAINNVSIEGSGRGTYFANDGGTALFSAGVQSNWVFQDFSTDAGGLTTAGATGWVKENILEGAVYTAYRMSGDVYLGGSLFASSNLDIGGYDFRAQTFTSDVATGTSPFTISSTTTITNLSSDLVDGYQSARSATFTVAASDSSAQSIAQADYVCNGTADNVQIQAAIDALPSGGGKVSLSEGTFVLAIYLTIPSNVTLSGVGFQTFIDATALSYGISGVIRINGTITATTSLLTSNAAALQKDVIIADASSFSKGNWIRIKRDGLLGIRARAEMHRIASIAGNTLTLELPLADAYTTADNAIVTLLTMIENVTLNDFYIKGSGANQIGIISSVIHNLKLQNLKVTDFGYTAMQALDIATGSMTGCVAERGNTAGNGYGLVIGNCARDFIGSGNHFYDCRHAITTAGGDGSDIGVSRNLIFNGNTAYYASQSTYEQFDVHSDGEYITFSNNVVIGANLGKIRSNHISFIGNTVKGATGTAIYIDSGRQYSNISNNYIETTDIGIEVGGSNHRISGNTFIINAGAVKAGIYIRPRNGYGVSDLKITGNDFIADGTTNVIGIHLYYGDGGILASESIDIHDNSFKDIRYPVFITSSQVALTGISVKLNSAILEANRSLVYTSVSGTGSVSDIAIIGNRIKGTNTTTSYGGLFHHDGGTVSGVDIYNNYLHTHKYAIYTTSVNISDIRVGGNRLNNVPNGLWVGSAMKDDLNVLSDTDGLGRGETKTFFKRISYDDTSPVEICVVDDGYAVTDVWVEVVTTFDDGGAAIDIGDGGTDDGYLANAKIDLTSTGYYGIEADDGGAYLWDAGNTHRRQLVYTSADTVDCKITRTNGTQGVAIIYIKITRIGG